jgi:ubiquinone/menaquinone biosynthesis C-methylase UbiE
MPEYYLEYLRRTDRFPQSLYHSAKHAAVRELFGSLAPGASVLDAASGIGNISGRYAGRFAVTGIDQQLSASSFSRRHYPGRYLAGDLYRLPFAGGRFDAVLFLDSIEHFDRPELALSELARVLKPGGAILICTINYRNPLWFVLENTWHRLFAGSCRTYSRDVHPTRYTASLLRRHCRPLFDEAWLARRMIWMELFYLGRKRREAP